jgi:c-di-GMP-binding flagellar brake protein YcgR
MNFDFGILKVGSLVEMELMSTENKMIKLKTIVEEVVSNDKLKLFAPVSRGKSYPLRLGQGFTMIVVHKYPTVDKYDILSCRCKIDDRSMDGNVSTILVSRNGDFSQIQRRNYFRLPLIKNIPITYDNQTIELLSKDLSGNGIRGYVSKKVPADTEIFVNLEVNDRTLNLRTKVIECNPDPEHHYRYELRGTFVNIKNTQLSHLMKYIYSKQSEAIRKQIDLKDYVSLVDSEKGYSDFFTMTNMEKVVRIGPVLLWALTLVQYAYLVRAFREQNMGLNYFFGEFTSNFTPEFIKASNSVALITLLIAVFFGYLNIKFNSKTKTRVSINIFLVGLLSLITIIIYNILI